MSPDPTSWHDELMAAAIAQAVLAEAEGDVPIGAAIGREGRVLAVGRNQRAVAADPTAHAEMLAIRAAAAALGDWRLSGCTLAVTLEPCCMCAGAIVLARIPTVVYGATDPKAGAVATLYRLLNDPRLNHQVDVIAGVRAAECGQMLSAFFQKQRALGKK